MKTIIGRPLKLDFHTCWIYANDCGGELLHPEVAENWARIDNITESFWLSRQNREEKTAMIFDPKKRQCEWRPKTEYHHVVFYGDGFGVRNKWDTYIRRAKQGFGGFRFKHRTHKN